MKFVKIADDSKIDIDSKTSQQTRIKLDPDVKLALGDIITYKKRNWYILTQEHYRGYLYCIGERIKVFYNTKIKFLGHGKYFLNRNHGLSVGDLVYISASAQRIKATPGEQILITEPV